jgi:hypothetical protein
MFYGRAKTVRGACLFSPVRIGDIGRVCRRVQRALPGLVGGVPGVAFTPPFGQPAQVPDLKVGRVDPGGCVPALGKLAGDGGKEVGWFGQTAVGEIRPQAGAGDWP